MICAIDGFRSSLSVTYRTNHHSSRMGCSANKFMSYIFEQTTLWKNSLAPRAVDTSPESRERLRSSFLKVRERVALLAGEIHRDLPEYTVHDITHLDSLWEMADIIAGAGFPLTPSEAYTLGGSILLHDLGMALASYPKGIEELKREETWADIITSIFLRQTNRRPTQDEISNPPNAIKSEAIGTLLRNLHGKRAEDLAFISWQQASSGPIQFLIEDTDLRQTFGRIIGRIAHSHWWPVARVEKEFRQTLGAPSWAPADWTINPLKIACLLRVADASHVDARRAPSFLRALRDPGLYSDQHWNFQEKLQKPHLNDDALAYTSGHAFTLAEANSWWLCLDTVKMIDRELRQVDALLADKSLQRFSARRVGGVESAERFVSYVPTDGWLPVNASLQISDVPRLVKNLGGQELYGADLAVPVRELIQNAADAIRVRRFVEGREDSWGNIYVRIGRDSIGEWLEVEDNGIGMSEEVLTRYLLDFGTSYWGSNSMIEEFPGLLSEHVKLTGKYGIGFFSAFMLGPSVRISTRRFDAAQTQTLVLEFNTGLSARPILRQAHKSERSREGGTCIRVWLDKGLATLDSILTIAGRQTLCTLDLFTKELCPALDVNVIADEGNGERVAVSASDWLTMSGVSFFERFPRNERGFRHVLLQGSNYEALASNNLRPLINESGDVVGRACITVGTHAGAVTVGGLLACRLSGITGVLIGTPVRAARDVALPLVSKPQLAKWASEQARLVPKVYDDKEHQNWCAMTVRQCGGDTHNLPIARYRDEWVTYNDLSRNKNLPSRLVLVEPENLSYYEGISGFSVRPDVIIVQKWAEDIIQTFARLIIWPNDERIGFRRNLRSTLSGAVIEAVAEAWDSSYDELLNSAEYDPEGYIWENVGDVDGDPIEQDVIVIIKPRPRKQTPKNRNR